MKATMNRGICKLCGGTFWESFKGARGEDICDNCEEKKSLYCNYVIYYDPPPIPIRSMDWHFHHKDYDGAEDCRAGHGSSEQDCKNQIDDLIDDSPERYS